MKQGARQILPQLRTLARLVTTPRGRWCYDSSSAPATEGPLELLPVADPVAAFPVGSRLSPPIHSPEVCSPRSPKEPTDPNRPAVLWIDDEVDPTDAAVRVLESEHFSVDCARRAESGVPLARSDAYSAILLDLRLADASGLDVLRTLKDSNVAAPVVVLTGFGTADLAVKAGKLRTPEADASPVDGGFEIQGILPGAYALDVRLEDGQWWPRSAMLNGRDLFDSPILFTADSTNSVGVVVTLSNRVAELVGSLVDADGAPSSQYVVVFPVDRSLRQRRSRRIAWTRPDTSGHFTIRGLPGGEYLIAALEHLDANDLERPNLLDSLANAALKVRLREGDVTALNLRFPRSPYRPIDTIERRGNAAGPIVPEHP